MRALVVVVSVLAVAACGGGDRTEARLMDYTLLGPSRVQVTVDGCHTNPTVTLLEETPTEVRLTVHRDPDGSWLGQGSCAGSVVLDLDEPLGSRSLVSAASGVAVPNAQG